MRNDEAGATCSADEQLRMPLPRAMWSTPSVSRLTDGQLRAMQFSASGLQVSDGAVAIADVGPITMQGETVAALFAGAPVLLRFYRAFKACGIAMANGDEAAFKVADKDLDAIDLEIMSRLGPLA